MSSKNAVGELIKSVGGGARLKLMNKSINKFRPNNATVSTQYFVLIPSSTRLDLYKLLSMYFTLLCIPLTDVPSVKKLAWRRQVRGTYLYIKM